MVRRDGATSEVPEMISFLVLALLICAWPAYKLWRADTDPIDCAVDGNIVNASTGVARCTERQKAINAARERSKQQ